MDEKTVRARLEEALVSFAERATKPNAPEEEVSVLPGVAQALAELLK